MGKILIIGDRLDDVYIELSPKKISAEAPILVYEALEDPHVLPGGAANVEALFKQLGHETHLLTGYSRFQINPLKPHLREKRFPRKTRLMCDNVQLFRYDSDDTVESVFLGWTKQGGCTSCNKINLDDFSAIVIADYQKGSIKEREVVSDALSWFAKRTTGSPLYVHTKGDPSPWLKAFSPPPIMFVNRDEYAKYIEAYDHFELVVRTLGPAGAELVRYGQPFYWLPSFANRNVSTNGAGDAFMAGFINEHLLSGVPQRALAVGNIASALTLARPYCGFIKNQEELYEHLQEMQDTESDSPVGGEDDEEALGWRG